MPFDAITIAYGLIIIAVLLLAEGLYYLALSGPGTARNVNRRLRMLAQGQTSEQVLQSLLRRPLELKGRWYEDMLQPLDRLLNRAGSQTPVLRFLLFMLLAVVGIYAAGVVMFSINPFFSLAYGLAGGIAAPLYIMSWRAKRIMNRFGEQLPDTIDLIVRSLQAGHPINSAMAMVASEMPDPIGTQFGIAVDEITYGLNLDQALDNMASRVDHPDLNYVIVSTKIQAGTGGNLAEVLSNASWVIRERYRMHRKIKALSAEGRISAWILTILPFFVFGMINLLAPTYYTNVRDDPLFPYFMGFGLVMMTLGIFIMWRLVKIKV